MTTTTETTTCCYEGCTRTATEHDHDGDFACELHAAQSEKYVVVENLDDGTWLDEASAEQRARAEDLVNKRLEKLGLLPPADATAAIAFEKADAKPSVEAEPPKDPVDEAEEDEDEDEDEPVEPKKEERNDA